MVFLFSFLHFLINKTELNIISRN
uniref:Uncharacterized protein n=1 Tax=Rhizophora mucronata TaxID=61149 RepID=A0A2P2IZS1_RHIMU